MPSADSPHAPGAAGLDGDGAGGHEELPEALLDTHPAVRALAWLLEYAAGRAHTDGEMSGDVLHLAADALAARRDSEAVAGAIGVQLAVLHRRATVFTAAHPELYKRSVQGGTSSGGARDHRQLRDIGGGEMRRWGTWWTYCSYSGGGSAGGRPGQA
ncbi:hypothetical protein [Streptomyces longwoodensis]|uniref:hypothetical protein n=1 Tax=Streptomyces longwoodensis TaxID=68231 RepID=UPI0030E3A8C7